MQWQIYLFVSYCVFLGNCKIYTNDDDIFLSCQEDMGLCQGFCKIDIVDGIEKNNCYDFFFYEDASMS